MATKKPFTSSAPPTPAPAPKATPAPAAAPVNDTSELETRVANLERELQNTIVSLRRQSLI